MPQLEELLLTIDASTEGLRRELKRGDSAVGDFERGVLNSTDRVQQSLDRLAARSKQFVDKFNASLRVAPEFASAQRARDIDIYGQKLDQLRAKFNPLFAAGQQYKAQLAEINQALRVGAISEDEAAAARLRLKTATQQQVSSLRGFGTVTASVAGSSGNLGFAIQNAANQFADLSVQVGGGTSLLRALSQQLPQLLGPFGAVGAVAGAAAAIVAGLPPRC